MAIETLYATSLTSGAVSTSANALGAPDGVFTTDTGNTNWTARFAMGNPTNTQANGTHSVTLRVRKEPTQSGTPTISTITVYQGGTTISSTATGWNVTSTTGQDITVNFSTASITDTSNIDVEVATVGTGGSPSVRASVQLDGITWSGDFTAPAPNAGTGTGSWAVSGTASGSQPALGIGSSTGSWSVTGAAVGANGEVQPGFVNSWKSFLTNSTNLSITVGTAPTAGNLLLFFATYNRAEANLTVPSGFTELSRNSNGTGSNLLVCYKTAVGDETSVTATATLGTSNVAAVVAEFAGVNTSAPAFTEHIASAAIDITVGPQNGPGLLVSVVGAGPGLTEFEVPGAWNTFVTNIDSINSGATTNNVGIRVGERYKTDGLSTYTTSSWTSAVNAVAAYLVLPVSTGTNGGQSSGAFSFTGTTEGTPGASGTTTPTFIGVTSDSADSPDTTLSLNAPVGLQSGHDQYIFLFANSPDFGVPSAPAGWLKLGEYQNPHNAGAQGESEITTVYWSDSDTATVNFTLPTDLEYWHGVRVAYSSGGAGTGAWRIQNDTLTRDTSAEIADRTTIANNSMVVSCCFAEDTVGPGTWSVPSGWTERYNAISATASGENLRMVIGDVVAATPTTVSGAFTSTSNSWGTTWTFVLTPGATAANSGSAVGSWSSTGSAAGTTTRNGSSIGASSWVGSASGSSSSPATINITNKAAGSSGSAVTTATTTSVTPAADSVLLLTVSAFVAASTNPATPSISGCNLTWTLVSSVVHDDAGTDRAAAFLFEGRGASPTAGTIDITHAAAMRTGWVVDEVTGVDTTAPIVQTASVAVIDSTATTTLIPFSDSVNNAAYASFAVETASANTFTPEAGWTALGSTSDTSYAHAFTAWRTGEDTSPSGSWSVSARSGLIAVELKVASGGGSNGVGSVVGSHSWTGSASGPITLPGSVSNPVTLEPVEPEAMGHNPPFIDSNGALYKFMESEPGINPVAMKSTDGGVTWAEAGAATHPTDMDDVEGFWVEQVGDTIWVAQVQNGDAVVHLAQFHTSDHPTLADSWSATETVDTDAGAGSAAAQWVSFNFLSDGSAWFFYQNAAYRKRNSNGTYDTRVAVSVGQYPMPVTGPGDVTHLFVTTTTEVQYRTLTSAGSLSATTRVDTTGHYGGSTAYGNTSNAVYFDNAGVETVACLYTEANGTPWLALVEDGVLSRTQVGTVAVGVDQDTATGGGPDLHLAVDGTTLHMLWSEDVSGDLVYRTREANGTLSSPTVLRAGGGTTFAFYPYNNILTRPNGSKVMGYTYDRGPHLNGESRVEYNEVALASPPNAGAASGAHTWTHSTSGEAALEGTSTGSFSWTATNSGAADVLSDWSSPVAATTQSGVASGSASGTSVWTGTSVGEFQAAGISSSSHTWSGTATGAFIASGSAIGANTWSATASGASSYFGAASGSHAWTGAAAGGTTSSSTATGAHSWIGAATGTFIPAGSAIGASSWTGTADSTAVSTGSATGAHSWAGAATGATSLQGTIVAAFTWSATTTGLGSTTSAWSNPASATTTSGGSGAVIPKSVPFTVSGQSVNVGSIVGLWDVIASAVGARASSGSASAVHVWTATSSGERKPVGYANRSAIRHYVANQGTDVAVYAVGFDVVDVGPYVATINALPAGVMALVWVGQKDPQPIDQAFMDDVDALAANPKVFGWYLSDEPHIADSPNGPANLASRADYIRVATGGTQKSYISLSTQADYEAFAPEFSHVDLFAINPYPYSVSSPSGDLGKVNTAVATATAAGIPLDRIVPTIQAFGQENVDPLEAGYEPYYNMPTAAQMHDLLNRWREQVPNRVIDYAYTWGHQTVANPTLVDTPDVQAVMAEHFSAGDFTWSGTASGYREYTGSSTSSWNSVGVAAGLTSHSGTASATWNVSAVVAGTRSSTASSSGTWAIAGIAAGESSHVGAGLGLFSVLGTANGFAPLVDGNSGFVAGSFSVTGSSSGNRESLGQSTSTFQFSGTAQGDTARDGAASNGFAWAGAASGSHQAVGDSTGLHTWTGITSGTRTSSGSSSAVYTVVATTSGTTERSGNSSGAFIYVHSSTIGTRPSTGQSISLVEWTGTGTSTTSKFGTSSGAFVFIGAAHQFPPVSVDVTIAVGATRVGSVSMAQTRPGTTSVSATRGSGLEVSAAETRQSFSTGSTRQAFTVETTIRDRGV